MALLPCIMALAAQDPAVAPLNGFADLHAHPAAHFGFGADRNGNEGIMWGKPGLSADAPQFQTDLRPCDGRVVRLG